MVEKQRTAGDWTRLTSDASDSEFDVCRGSAERNLRIASGMTRASTRNFSASLQNSVPLHRHGSDGKVVTVLYGSTVLRR